VTTPSRSAPSVECTASTRPGWVALAAVVLVLGGGVLATTNALATTPAELLTHEAVRHALEVVRSSEPVTLDQQARICEIPAPPFKEASRAQAVRERFAALGLENVRVDELGNVIGERRGRRQSPTLVLAAHLDTVFPEGTPVTVTRNGNLLKGPGIGDDCRGLAVLFATAEALGRAHVVTEGSIIFAADVGEEGLGNLRGVRALLEGELKGRATHFISVDASGYDLINREIGSHRYRVTYHGPGGHSYWAFGLPSAIHGLGRAIDRIANLKVPAQPRTTFTVGRIEGGTSVNSIARTAWMEVDLRSEGAAELDALDAQLHAAVRAALDEENAFWPSEQKLTMEIEPIGTRPVGVQAPDAPIVVTALAVDRALGITSNVTSGSTDAGMPVRLGIPAIALGGGGRWLAMHSPEESFDSTDSYLGTQRVLLLSLALVGVR